MKNSATIFCLAAFASYVALAAPPTAKKLTPDEIRAKQEAFARLSPEERRRAVEEGRAHFLADVASGEQDLLEVVLYGLDLILERNGVLVILGIDLDLLRYGLLEVLVEPLAVGKFPEHRGSGLYLEPVCDQFLRVVGEAPWLFVGRAVLYHPRRLVRPRRTRSLLRLRLRNGGFLLVRIGHVLCRTCRIGLPRLRFGGLLGARLFRAPPVAVTTSVQQEKCGKGNCDDGCGGYDAPHGRLGIALAISAAVRWSRIRWRDHMP